MNMPSNKYQILQEFPQAKEVKASQASGSEILVGAACLLLFPALYLLGKAFFALINLWISNAAAIEQIAIS